MQQDNPQFGGSLPNIESAILAIASAIRPDIPTSISGWVEILNETWVYASATTITVPAGATARYQKGDKLRLYQSGTVKYFYITSLTDTVLTITGGSDYTLANATIESQSFSKDESPLGFPTYFNWTPTFANFTKGSATITARFTIQGGKLHFYLEVVLSSSTMGTIPTFTLPVTAITYTTTMDIAKGQILDTGTSSFPASAQWLTTGTATMKYYTTTGQNITATQPMTWANGDIYSVNGWYFI